MNEQTKNYLLIGVAALTVVNSFFIFTMDKGGRVIDTPKTNTAIVESTLQQTQQPQQASTTLDLNQTKNQEVAPAPVGPPTSIGFAQMEHDFGTIDQNTENTHVFSFTNTGQEPLIIQDAKGSCGCTVPKYPKNPLAPGETGEIEVVYKPGTQKGNQMKTVTLVANTLPTQTVLKISALVEEVKS